MKASTHELDDRLIERIRSQDEMAFRELFDKYYPRVFAFVRRRLDDPALSEEVVGDVFFEVWRSAAVFRGASRVSTWIFGIATFKSLEADRNRRRLKRSTVVSTDDEILQQAPDQKGAVAYLEARSELRWIEQRIGNLSDSQRQVAELALLEGRSTEEIASQLGISTGTVKSRLSRARRELRPRPPRGRGEMQR